VFFWIFYHSEGIFATWTKGREGRGETFFFATCGDNMMVKNVLKALSECKCGAMDN
jgi:hypothetical protein